MLQEKKKEKKKKEKRTAISNLCRFFKNFAFNIDVDVKNFF